MFRLLQSNCGEIQSTCPNYDNTVLQISKQAAAKHRFVEKSSRDSDDVKVNFS